MEVFKLNKIFTTTIVARPSKIIKSPYLADIIDPTDKTKNALAHTPSLGASGMAIPDAKVVVSKKNVIVLEKNTKVKSTYSIDMIILKENKKKILVGVNPYYANDMVETMIKNNFLKNLKNMDELKREVTIKDSRLDFVGKKDNITYYIEVKNVPIASNNISIFPDGYRKKKTDPISPRAIKHLELLSSLAKKKNSKAYMIYIIQRDDTNSFVPNIDDPHYRNAFIKAKNNGVKMIICQIKWVKNKAFYIKDLPIGLK